MPARTSTTFSDLDLNFGIHPVTKDLIKLTGEDAIKASLKNLILTNHYERPFEPDIGSNIRYSLFENLSPLTAINITKFIEETVDNFESRVSLDNVEVVADYANNGYEVHISYFLKNSSAALVDVNLFLERLR